MLWRFSYPAVLPGLGKSVLGCGTRLIGDETAKVIKNRTEHID